MEALTLSSLSGPTINDEKRDSPQPILKVHSFAMDFFLTSATVAFGLVSCYYNPLTFTAGIAIGFSIMYLNIKCIPETLEKMIQENILKQFGQEIREVLDSLKDHPDAKSAKLQGPELQRWAFAKMTFQTDVIEPIVSAILAFGSHVSLEVAKEYNPWFYRLSLATSLCSGFTIGQLAARKIFYLNNYSRF